jgi:hypothetical protein
VSSLSEVKHVRGQVCLSLLFHAIFKSIINLILSFEFKSLSVSCSRGFLVSRGLGLRR